MHLFIAFSVGLITAIVSSLPMGPLSIRVVQMALTEGRRAAILMGIGGMIAELLFCVIALFGLKLILGSDADLPDQNTLLDDLYPFTIPVLLIMGILAIVNRNKLPDPNKRRNAGGPLLIGIALCLSNPMLFTFWVSITTFLQSGKFIGSTLADHVMFTLGVALGIFSFYYTITRIATGSKRTMGPLWRKRVNVGFGVFFIGFAVYLAVRFIIDL
jgi:threonine/homoserine/homoserine lactone efflux protein